MAIHYLDGDHLPPALDEPARRAGAAAKGLSGHERRRREARGERREAIECWNEIAANEFGNQRSCRRLAAFSDACETQHVVG